MRRAFPRAADGIRIVPHAADVAAIRAARPFAVERQVVLAVGRLSRRRHFDRAIAAMAGLDPALMLVIVGDGPARRSLQAHAHDLEVSSQVRFVRRVSEEGLYRWLRTARAFVSLGDEEVVDPELLEVFAAGIPVVASDTSAHREAAPRVPGAALLFVSPEGSPFEIADAIGEAVRRGPMLPPRATVPSWNAVVKRTLGIYEELASGPPLSAQHQRSHRPLDSVAEG
jgi:glycosyltransferase involved in cell wall biosynthesis